MPQPNILFILTDQQHFRTLKINGCPEARTPNLDRLAAEGLNFRNHMTAHPVCMPARAAIWSGRMPSDTGMYANGCRFQGKPPRTFVADLNEAGYHTAHFGKMHLVPCMDRRDPHPPGDFQEFSCAEGDQWLLHDDYNMWFRKKDPQAFMRHYMKMMREDYNSPHTADVDEENTHSHWVTEQGLTYLDRRRRSEEPFFLSLGYFDPHHAFNPCEPYASRWKDAAVSDPFDDRGFAATLPECMRPAFEDSLWERKPEYLREVIRCYHAMMEQIDVCVGRLLEKLEANGQLENTIVVFSSDHGEFLGNHGKLFKGGYLLDDLLRVPLIAWHGDPTRRRAEQVETVTSTLDVHPTFLRLAGVENATPPSADSRPLLDERGNALPEGPRGYAISEWRSMPMDDPRGDLVSIRTDTSRLTLYGSAPEPTGELYLHGEDPWEMRNRFPDPACRKVRDELTGRLRHAAPDLPDAPPPSTLW